MGLGFLLLADVASAERLLPASVLKRLKSGDHTFTVVPVGDEKFKNNLGATY
ncbi:MAG: hypothetical protein P8R42_05905 [Candidatus Binatia bacterium]|nr:hypothetical protein [Candidatus Binatia bacterium]